jgi:hypothetical protein
MNNLLFLFLFIITIIFVKEFLLLKTKMLKIENFETQVTNTTKKSKDTNIKQKVVNKQLELGEKKIQESKKNIEDIEKRRSIKTFDEKEKDYEKNLKEQEKIEKKIKEIEKQRAKEFVIEYKEATKTEKEIGKLKNEIKKLKSELNKCKTKNENNSSVSLKKKEDTIQILKNEKKPIVQNSVDKNLIKSKSVKNEIEYVVGCNKDSDCNLFYGEGRNTCKSNNTCRCEVGSGVLCQYGPTNYKDPKDMTKKEKSIFKNMSNYDNFTIQDYKNWLKLYKNDYYLLSDEHLINLRKVLRGESIRLRDIPNSGIYPPDTSQRYFSEMYDKLTNSEKIVTPINSSTTGNQVGYNYMDYSGFSKPESLSQLRVVNGEIERKYRRPSAKNKIWPSPLGNTIKKKDEAILLEDAIGPYQQNPNI